MNRPWILLLLGASLAFNAMFLLGRYRAQRALEQAQDSNQIEGLVSERLGISGSQLEAFEGLKRRSKAVERRLAAQDRVLFESIWENLASADPSVSLINERLSRSAEHVRSLNQTNAALLVDFLAQLEPAQRETLLLTLRERHLFKYLWNEP